MSEVFRGLHILKRDDQGAERCTACGLCALACPAEAITMTAAERKPEERNCTARRNMHQFMKSICCDVSFVVCVKKHAPRPRYSYKMMSWLRQVSSGKILYMEKIDWLNP